MGTPVSPLRRNRDFALVWAGGTVSSLGTAISAVAMPLVTYRTTGSLTAASSVIATGAVFTLLCLPAAGILVDRWERKYILVFGNVVGLLVLGYLSTRLALGRVSLLELTAGAAILGMRSSFVQPASMAVLRTIVPTTQLAQAQSLNEARNAGARIMGGPLGGALYAVNAWLPLAIDSLTYLINAVCAGFIRADTHPGTRPPQQKRAWFSEAFKGIRWIWPRTIFRRGIYFCVLVNVGLTGLTVAMSLVLIARHTEPALIGALNTAAAIGGIAGALAAPVLVTRLRPAMLLATESAMLVIATGLMAWNATFVNLAIGAVLATLFLPATGSSLEAFQISQVPNDLQGRVAAAVQFASSVLSPLGPVLAGVLVASFGSSVAFGVLGSLFLMGCLAVLLTRSVWRIGTPSTWDSASDAA